MAPSSKAAGRKVFLDSQAARGKGGSDIPVPAAPAPAASARLQPIPGLGSVVALERRPFRGPSRQLAQFEAAAAPASPLLGQLNLSLAGSSGEQFQTEISAFVSLGGKLFILSSGGGSSLQVSDATNPAAATLVARQPLGAFTSQSVASFGNLVAVALSPADYDTNPQPGVVRFYQLGLDGSLRQLAEVAVGYLPDGIAFNADGTQLVVANEGQPNIGVPNGSGGNLWGAGYLVEGGQIDLIQQLSK